MPSDPASESKLANFGGYQKARQLFDLIVDDLIPLARNPACSGLVRQQIDAADSICANIEEGYGRGTRKEFIQFLRFARGSAREVRGRCERFSRWLPEPVINERASLANEILAILSRTLKTLESR